MNLASEGFIYIYDSLQVMQVITGHYRSFVFIISGVHVSRDKVKMRQLEVQNREYSG